MKNLFLIISIFWAFTINSQTIRTSIGFAGYGNPFDGVYYSFDVGFPLTKGIEIAPTFTFNSNLKYKKIEYYSNSFQNEEFMINDNNDSGGNISGLIELFLIINPLKLINKGSKTDIGLGMGYGYNFYFHNYYNYNDNNELIGIHNTSGIRNSLSFKGFYNYNFDRFFIGVIFGIVDITGNESNSNSILGLQFGKSF